MGLRRILLTVVLLAGALNGCGADGGRAGELVLADTVTGEHFSLRVSNGGPALSTMGDAGRISASRLTDSVTGKPYQVAVSQGALTLVLSPAPGAAQIDLVDTVTANAYALKVVSGALTLSRN